jgi:cytochrome oxidase Cu insertion factor (SCO1/SenC/PrrC family)
VATRPTVVCQGAVSLWHGGSNVTPRGVSARFRERHLMPGMGKPPGAGSSTIVHAFHAALGHQAELILVMLVLLFVAWNGLRSLQYRRAVANGDQFPPPRSIVPPEAPARRLLRIGFGALWIVDGLLQLQQAMPLDMPTTVLRPAASTSPAWVKDLVDFGVDAWTRHPTTAAASAVWIQIGIGVFLLVAPRGRWSRAAGLTSVGWGLVVWVFGEAFGGIFAPGLTVLFGAPGGVLLYVVAGALISLPERMWVGPKIGRIITGSGGGFLLLMAVLQAWPGRGFWQGGTSANPGTLAGMVQQMATTSQPHFLSDLVSSFAAFDETHGWGVNLAVVVALSTTGLALLSGRRRLLFPTVAVLVVLGVADWIFIEDFGVWGGTGTDPNSMIPLLVLLAAGYLATVRVPVTATTTSLRPAPVVRIEGIRQRRWWELVDSGYAGRLAAAVGAIVVVLIGTAPMVSASVNSRTDTDLAEAVAGVPQVIAGRAPRFDLVDQRGRPISLADLQGYTVAMTFLDPVCTTDCPVIAQEFRAADQMLGSAAAKVRFVAIAANPQYHSITAIDDFDREEGLNSQPNWLYLTGSSAALHSVLNAYGVAVANGTAGSMTIHADMAYVIDARGVIRRILIADPGDSSADHSSISNLLVSQIDQVMHS